MSKNKNKYYKDFGITAVDKEFLNKQELHNLFKKPKKDNKINEPHTQVEESNIVHQADLLFLPNDDGYRYLLVVVDSGSRLTDVEPLKDKKSETVKAAFEDIYSREILKLPKRIEVDSGSEFKGIVKKYFMDHKIFVRYAKPGRHRQQALVERRNQIVGDALMKRMAAQELITGQPSLEWVEEYPIILKAINKKYGNVKQKEYPQEPLCHGDACNVLEVGTKVRAILDEPREVSAGKRVPGRFRSGDTRWDTNIRIIKQVLLKPGYPVMYLLDGKGLKGGIEPVPYTKSQLQVIPKDEESPPSHLVRGEPETYVVEKIVDKKKKKNRIYYLVKWKSYAKKTWEPRTTLIEDVPNLIEQYEANQ